MAAPPPPDDRSAGTRLPGRPDGPEWLTVTSPLLPDLDELVPLLADVLDRRWVTNQGHYARQLELELAARLGVPELLLITNCTIALEMAVLEAVPPGEVICTAYSFPATWNMLFENSRYRPVFVDIGDRFCIDPAAVEAAITPMTTAIMAVHPYGFPCDDGALKAIARRHGLRLIYDAAHVFGVSQDGVPLGAWGDLSAFSFHATKVYNTLEGGALTGDPELLERLARRRNFGLVGDDQLGFGTNGKVDEFRAVVGLLNLKRVDAAIAARMAVADAYLAALPALGIDGLTLYPDLFHAPGRVTNASYFPVRLDPAAGLDRDAVHSALKTRGILAKRYFFPTAASSELYANQVRAADVPRARAASHAVLCLPIHHQMTDGDVDHVVDSLAWACTARP